MLGLEVSRLARNNADWHRLIELGGLTDTLIGDADGINHTALNNDRLMLGLKGLPRAMKPSGMSCVPASTAAFATRRRAVNCAEDCRSALSGARPMARSASTPTRPSSPPSAMSSRALPRPARRVASGYGFVPRGSLNSPLQMHQGAEIRWVEAKGYTAIHHVLAYKSRLMPAPTLMANHVGRRCWMHRASAKSVFENWGPFASEWQVLIPDHHPGFIDWRTYEANQDRIAQNTRPRPAHRRAAPVREGSTCCKACHLVRALRTPLGHAPSRTPLLAGVSLPRQILGLVEGRGVYWLNVGGIQIDEGRRAGLHRRPEPCGKLAATGRRRGSGSRPIARPRSGNGVSASRDKQAMKPAAPSAASAPTIPTTPWSLAASSANGRSA